MLASALALAVVPLAAACNLIIGAHERFLDPGDATTTRADRSSPDRALPDDEEDAGDEPADGGPDADATVDATVTIPVTGGWTSPNGATFTVSDAGVQITGYDATHPVVVPSAQPTISSESYTVHGIIRSPNEGEFGILARIQGNGAAVVLSSRYGGEVHPWLGEIGPPDWNPSKRGGGTAFTFVANTRYRFQLRVNGVNVSGKIWDATKTEPAFQTVAISTWGTGKGVGFYTYGIVTGAILETIYVTVP
jgi:hypothetical protein